MPKMSVRTIVAIGIGTALFFLLARFVSIPIFSNTNLTFQYAVLEFFAVIFGPIAGLLIGLIGHVLTDLTFGYGLWWSWIIVSACIGFASGFMFKGLHVEEGQFNKEIAVRFILGTILIQLVGWALLAPVLDILIYAEPANKVFTQGVIAAVSNIVTTCVVGTLLLFAYSKTKPQSGSLSKE